MSFPFLKNELSLTLSKLKTSNLDFLFNYKQYLIDEEYISNNKFIKCFHCDSGNIEFRIFNETDKKDFDNFCENFKDINVYKLLVENFDECVKKHKSLRLFYCKDCYTILNINNEDQVIDLDLNANNIIPLLIQEDFIEKKENITFPKQCPFCKNKNFYLESFDEDFICNNCNSYVISNDGKIHYYDTLNEYLNQKDNPIVVKEFIV